MFWVFFVVFGGAWVKMQSNVMETEFIVKKLQTSLNFLIMSDQYFVVILKSNLRRLITSVYELSSNKETLSLIRLQLLVRWRDFYIWVLVLSSSNLKYIFMKNSIGHFDFQKIILRISKEKKILFHPPIQFLPPQCSGKLFKIDKHFFFNKWQRHI